MKALKNLIVLTLLPFMTGCLNPHPGERPPQNWEDIARRVEGATQIGAVLAFQMDSVKPYKQPVCVIVQRTSEVLENINDPNATFDLIRQTILDQVLLLVPDEDLRNAATIVLTVALNEAFHYVETYYNDFLEQDQTRTVLIVANAISQGLKKACNANP